ncbi:MAG: NB-ARC domain-containing protein [Chloroflexia bacterium]
MLSEPDALDVPPLTLLGMSGIGKSALALAFGRQAGIQEIFPDGVLWASLGPSPDIHGQMVKWGEALGVDVRSQRGNFECKVQLQDALFRRKSLLIVDDVWSVSDGAYFMIGGPKCRTLLTTRESPVAYGLATRSRSLQIGVLDKGSAVDLLRRLVPEGIWESTLDLERLCDKLEYNPLAITLAGRLLASEADIPSRMRKLIDELTERKQSRLDLEQIEGRLGLREDEPVSLRGILGISVNRLARIDRKRFALLSVFGGERLTWDIGAVAAIWECTKEEAEESLSRLIQHGLVQRRTDGEYNLHALFADYATEVRIKMALESLVKASDLNHWANVQMARYKLPLLIRRLIHATVERIERIGFPADEGIQLGGWDGIVIVQTGNAFVPDGTSVWELGVNSDVKGKADDDYEKRRKDPLGLDPAKTTFIFVTPRRWGGKDKWIRERQKEGIWREVRAYDADDLEQWLDLAPAVHVWLSLLVGKHPEMAEDITSFWSDWSEATSPAVSPKLLTTGRDDAVNRVYEWLRGSASPLTVRASTREEAVAFLAATLQQLPPEQLLPYISRMVIVKDERAWNHLRASQSPLILVPLFEVGDAITRAVRSGHHIFLPLGTDDSTSSTTVDLPRLRVAHTKEVLVGMGLPEVRVTELAVLARRSVMALRRKLAITPEVQQPLWAKPESARALLPALLVGAWQDTQEGDRKVIARLANTSYEDVNAVLSRWANEADPPVRRTGDTWLLVSKEDAWSLLSRYLTRDDMERFEMIVLDVLGEKNPALELEPSQRIMAGLLGKTLACSGLLREGLADTVALMGARSESTHWSNVMTSQDRSNRIVQQLLARANDDWHIWSSLSYLLRSLAEAAPNEFLRQVEVGLNGTNPPLSNLFEDKDADLLSSSSAHTGLLWSLELLAWKPDYLSRVAVCLATLTRLDPGGKLSNRPINSLRDIFLPWYPCTTATSEQRLRVLDTLRSREPVIAWRLMNLLLPKSHDHTSPTAKPRWREWVPEQEPSVTFGDLWAMEREFVQRMISDARTDGQRWTDLIEHIDDVQPEQRDAIIAGLLAIDLAACPSMDRLAIWSALRSLISRHRRYPDAAWAMPRDVVDRLLEVYKHFEPAKLIEKYTYLFVLVPEIIDSFGEDWLARQTAISAAREEAVEALYEQGGLSLLLEFSGHVEQSGELGFVLGKSDLLGAEEGILINQTLGVRDASLSLVGRGFVMGRVQTEGWEWVTSKAADIATLIPSIERQAEFFSSLPFDGRTWDLLETASPDLQRTYWSHVRPRKVPTTDCKRAVEDLLTYGRPHIALELISLYQNDAEADLAPDLITTALEQATMVSPERQEDWDVLIHHAADILDKIEASGMIEESRIASLEFLLLPFLEHGARGPKVLHKQLSADPELFIAVLSLVYGGEAQEEQELTDNDAARVRLASKLLHTWRRVPGTQDDGTVDPHALRDWVARVREGAAAKGRSKIADDVIGQVLSCAPKDADGSWPCKPVREVIEHVETERLHWGFVVGVRNSRGLVQKSMLEGGDQERQLVETYQRYANIMRDQWPRTAAALQDIADTYRSDAHRSDVSAELEEDLWN